MNMPTEMMKPSPLKKGDRIAIVSLSSGILGEPFCKHQVDLGIERLKTLELIPVFMNNSLRGVSYLEEHPEARAQDLIQAFSDRTIKGVLCAIGGIDTYRVIPYLMNANFKQLIIENPKIFTGFSDTTNNHFMFYKLGMVSFYGPNFLNDIAELDDEMLPYTLREFQRFFGSAFPYEIESNDRWYEERIQFDASQLGTPRISHRELRGYDLIRGKGIVEGRLFGGCLESIVDMFVGDERYQNIPNIFDSFDLIPNRDELSEMILFLETSETKVTPKKFESMIDVLIENEFITSVRMILFGKPQDEVFYSEYRTILERKNALKDIPIIFNFNFGHSYPRTLIPYGIQAKFNCSTLKFEIVESYFRGE
ncbi:MAG: LD-carboxypeptidase [Erysipelothrix sp.]